MFVKVALGNLVGVFAILLIPSLVVSFIWPPLLLFTGGIFLGYLFAPIIPAYRVYRETDEEPVIYRRVES